MELKEENFDTNKPEFYLLITGKAGKNNYGILVRSASAFDCKEIYILGSNKNITKKFFGNHGTAKKMKYTYFSTVEELSKHCTQNNIQIYGVNINYKNDSNLNPVPIENVNFENKKTLFILGNSMYPIDKELEKIINKFTYVEQIQKEGTIFDLNLSIVGSIVMHYYGINNNYKMAGLNDIYNDEKYIVIKKDTKPLDNSENNKKIKSE